MEQGPGYSKGDVKYDIHPIIIAPPPPPSILRLNIQPAKLSCFAVDSSVYKFTSVLSAGQDRQEDWDAAKCPPASLAGRREVTGQIRMT